MPAERGFTLIEILVVVVIIGITLSFAMLAFGDFGASRRALVTAEQFSSYLKLVQQQAIIESSTLGVSLTKEGYNTYRFIKGSWQPMAAKNMYHPRNFPNNVSVGFQRKRSKNKVNAPDIIIITPSGDLSPFVVDFGTANKACIIRLIGKNNGQIILQQPKSS